MTPEFKKIYSIANNLANLVINEKGTRFTNIDTLKRIFKEDHLAQLLLSKVRDTPEKIKVLITTYFILNRSSVNQNDLESFLLNLYVTVIDLYEDKQPIEYDCGECGGDANTTCERCDGTGREDCGGCDGHQRVECVTCDGEGTEMEEDDEGDEIEVDCSDCGGSGDNECSRCDGNGYESCDYCEGYGEYQCGYCDGGGSVDSGEERYNIRRSFNVMIGDEFSKHEGKFLSVEDLNELEQNEELVPFNFEIYVNYFVDDDFITIEQRKDVVGMVDDFAEIIDVTKLESFSRRIDF